MKALFLFTFRQVLLERKVLLSVLLFLIPAALGFLVRSLENAESAHDLWERYHGPMNWLLLTLIIPIVCMLYGTALIGAEVESRTLVYLITRRLRRGTVLLVRFVAVALVITLLSEAATLLHFAVAFGRVDISVTRFHHLFAS